jgi:hypothetical protein
MRRAIPITLPADERSTLARWARGPRTPARVVLRAKIVLHAAAGLQNNGHVLRRTGWPESSVMRRARAVRPGFAPLRSSAL